MVKSEKERRVHLNVRTRAIIKKMAQDYAAYKGVSVGDVVDNAIEDFLARNGWTISER